MPGTRPTSLQTLGEHGVAMLECAIILPLLALMVIATYDLGGALNEYLTLTRASYEGARYAAVISGLEDGEIGTGSSFENKGNHRKVHERIQGILEKSKLPIAQQSDLSITTKYEMDAGTVRVRITKLYLGHFGLFGRLNLSVTATGPFLSKSPVSS